MPVPAAGFAKLRGQRIVIGLAGLGWRGDLRADDPVIQAARTYVPVLTEPDYYRAEIDQTEVFAPLVPVERVWVEQPGPASAAPPAPDLFGRLVRLDTPPDRPPVPASEVLGLTGRRVIELTADGERRDLRAVTEPYENADGDICIRTCAERDWYQWSFTGQPAKTRELPVHLVWAE